MTSSSTTTVAGTTVLITGANRGLGRALVEAALIRGAARVYAASRRPIASADERVTPLVLDVTDTGQIADAAEQVDRLDILVNNAGVSIPNELGDRGSLHRHLAVNLFGTWAVTDAFLPALRQSRGRVVNVVSLAAFAAVPVLPAYSVSKAAQFSLTQSLRALVAADGVTVHAVMPGPIDTDMVRDLAVPKTSAELVAQGIVEGVERGEEDIFPDPLAALFAEGWRTGQAKEFERQNAALAQIPPVAA
jgi:NAD(P)-dependent dehydrogenase (short-subunit alcohol dehydrogenase family)